MKNHIEDCLKISDSINLKYISPKNLDSSIDIKFISNIALCLETNEEVKFPLFGRMSKIIERKYNSNVDLSETVKSINKIFYHLISDGLSSKIIQINQDHFSNVVEFSKTTKLMENGYTISEISDAAYTKEKGVFLSLSTADCICCIMYSKKSKKISSAHLSVVLTEKNFIRKVINESFSKSELGSLEIYFGPSIDKNSYELQSDYIKNKEGFYKNYQNCLHRSKNGDSYFFDNIKCNILQLKEMGIKEAQIDLSCNLNTFSSKHFPSYRKGCKNNNLLEMSSRFISLCKIKHQ